MKAVVRTLVIVLLLAALSPLALVGAQDGGEDQNAAPVAAGAYYLEFDTGTFEALEDDAYLLTLDGVENEIVWIMTVPELSINALNNVNFNNNWAAADELSTDAVLLVGDLTIDMVVSSPAYDEESGVQTYEVTEVSVTSDAGEEEPELPLEFESASLSLAWSDAFQEGLLRGVENLFADYRATPAQCLEAQNAMDNYYTNILPPIHAQIIEAFSLCYGQNDAAACTLYVQLTIQLQEEWAQVEPYAVMLQNECTQTRSRN